MALRSDDVHRWGDYTASSDGDLLRRSTRDPEAFGAFYDRHAVTVLVYFQRRTACAESAADLTAETFATAFRSRRRYRDTGAPAIACMSPAFHVS
jgi:RNA polymerase sigma-70 factor, ECF subfamily